MRRTGQTFRVLLKAMLLASEEKQDIIIVVNKKVYGSSLIRRLYEIIKYNLGDFVEKNYHNKITLGNGSTITSMSFELYHKRCSQDAFRGKLQHRVLFDGSCDEVFTESYKRG